MPVTVRIRNAYAENGIETALGAPTGTPGLYVAKADSGWVIVHIRSGLIVGIYDDPETALACSADLAPLWDWTQSATVISSLSRSTHTRILAVCTRWGATEGHRPDASHREDL